MEGMEKLQQLDQLYLSHNGISTVEGLSCSTSLTTLDLAANMIAELAGMEKLKDLGDLWLNDNKVVCVVSACLARVDFSMVFFSPQVDDWNQLKHLEHMKELQTIYLERNPIDRGADYRRKLKLALPSLTQIDATLCR